MTLRFYANCPATTLTASIDASATIVKVAAAANFPALFPYVLILDEGETTEEVVLVTAAAGLDLTVTRGFDSTTAFSHSSGSGVVHGVSAIEFREANAHVNATAGVHGISGSVVGTTDAQTLTNKTLSTGTIIQSGTTINSPAISGGTLAGVVIRDTSILQGNSGNSQNPLSIRTVPGVEVGFVHRDGRLQVPRLDAISTDVATVPLLVKGVASQTADLVRVRTSAEAPGLEVSATGRIGMGRSPGVSTTVLVRSIAVGDPSLRVQLLASQTADPFSIVNDAGTNTVFRIDKDGERVPNAWINASLSGARQPFDTTPRYRRVDKWLEMEGTVQPNPPGAMPADTGYTLFTLPVGFRPARLQRHAVGVGLTGTGTSGAARLEVTTAGDVNLWTQDAPDWVALNSRIPLD